MDAPLLAQPGPLGDRASAFFETVLLATLRIFLCIVILIAVVDLWYLLWLGLRERLGQLASVPGLQVALQRAFSGVLLTVLGLELLETLRTYAATHHIRLEVILVVALIAVARHVMVLDFEHVDGARLGGAAALVIALAGGYYLVTLRNRPPHAPDSGPGRAADASD